ncbi:Crp/Fnr family transcriptional regulator [Psychromonas sp.]|uniref:Crp/Fnr family transcriptional regulator n=1 Tax=Psychromonas sp. TaxID=1884585 RepID=UPI003561CDF2
MRISASSATPSPELDTLLEGFRKRSLAANTLLSSPQDQDNRVFYISSGRLRVFLSCGDKVFTIALLNPGDIYCTHTRAHVEAIQESQVHVCDMQTFSRKIHQHPQLFGTITRVLSSTLTGCIDTIENLAFRDVRSRFACFLLSQLTGEEEQTAPVSIPLPFSIELLAQSISTSRQTLSTLISNMQKSGILARQTKGQILLLDIARLKKMADF